MAKTFFGVSIIPMNYKDEVRQIKRELLCFLGHPKQAHSKQTSGIWSWAFLFFLVRKSSDILKLKILED